MVDVTGDMSGYDVARATVEEVEREYKPDTKREDILYIALLRVSTKLALSVDPDQGESNG